NNIAVKLNGKFYTPPFFCGLLDGIMRKKLIEEKKIIEKRLFEKNLAEAEEIYLFNSVRGIIPVKYEKG
ncbi:MAG: aminotransferase class IV, partial [Spirochaetes bacterium]|nr:aminotransferase class IV [Spirochaetota bacterium]